MPPKVAKTTGKQQPKINAYARKLRRHNSAPGPSPYMADIEELDEFESTEEPIPDDAGIQAVINKINDISRRVEVIEHALYGDEGLKEKVAAHDLKLETGHGKQLFISKEYRAVKQDLGIVKGILQKQAKQVNLVEEKITDIMARSMSLNMVISGILEDRDENCRNESLKFLKNEMDIDLNMCPELKIKAAHRIGYKDPKKKTPRAMIMTVNHALKAEILDNIEKLSGRTNLQGDNFYINVQQPEARIEAKRNAKAILKKYQTKYKTAKVELRADKVYVNNEWQKPAVHAPLPQDLYYDPEEQKELNKIKIIYTQPEDAKSSTFWAAATRAETTAQVQKAYNKIRQDAPAVDHIAMAYVSKRDGEIMSGLVDDREHGAGFRILKAIRECKEEGIAVFVARKYGGEHIGPSRFQVITRSATKAMEQLNKFIPPSPRVEPESSQSPYSANKSQPAGNFETESSAQL